jgi:SAM-dependent methyltransferase
VSHRFSGHCPVCRKDAEYTSHSDWYRDNLLCGNCGSIPRERAFAWVLDTRCSGWQDMVVHESSPADRLVSTRMRNACAGYVGSQFFPGIPAGEMHDGYRCENLEQMTFADGSIDLHCHLDVLEHVNHPDRCFAEMERTLKPGGHMVFTTPVYEGLLATERTAYYDDDHQVHFLGEPEYHGNPIDDQGAAVTFHYGQDLADLILMWTRNCGVQTITLNDARLGVLGKFREVFVVRKHG